MALDIDRDNKRAFVANSAIAVDSVSEALRCAVTAVGTEVDVGLSKSQSALEDM